MRSLERNKITVYYALYIDRIPVLDEWGNETGQFQSGFSNPVKIKIRVSPNKGESQSQAFGLSLDYDRTMLTTDSLPIDEQSVLWIDTLPVIENDGSTATPFDYTIKRVAKDINQFQYAVKKVVK
jgi:hypothetical protein